MRFVKSGTPIALALLAVLGTFGATHVLSMPARPLPPQEIRETPRTPKVIRGDIAAVEKAIRKDQKELDRLARDWKRSGESDPEGELTLKMQGLRVRIEMAEVRLVGLRRELKDADVATASPELAVLRLEIAKQASLVEDLRRQLVLARTEERIQETTGNLRKEEQRLEELRSRYWREAGPPEKR